MKLIKGILAIAAIIVAFHACAPKKNTSTAYFNNSLLYCKAVKNLNDVVLENNFPPMIAARNYAYANIAAYECMAAGNKNYQTLSKQIKHLPAMPTAPAGVTINYNLAALLSLIKVGNAVTFPEGSLMATYEQLKKDADSVGMPEDELQHTIAFSDSVVSTILKWSKGDHYAQTRSAEKYTVENKDGRWIPTPPMYASAVEPHWMEIRPLVLDSASQFMPVRPPVFDVTNKNSSYYKALLEVKNIGDSLTEEQRFIADFWDDNPFKMNVSGHAMFASKKFSPAGHWMNIVGIAAQKSKADVGATIAAYTQTAIALFDAFISCWDEKYRSNFIRPETAIAQYINDAWRPYIQTPPFPSYTSGHATISAAAAEVMANCFGDTINISDTSLLAFGIKSRNIVTFRNAAKEAAMSRLYGGIHYRFDNEAGNQSGTKLGIYIVEKLRLKNK